MLEKIIENKSIHYWTNNNKIKETILFLHPAFANHMCFEHQFKYFNEEYNIIALDLVGHGKSTGSTSIIETSTAIKKILDLENIEKVNLVGVSIGAILIQDFANKYPDLVASLCCIGGYDINNFDYSI